MEQSRTIARPYAKAVFELASETGTLDEWAHVLQALASVAIDPKTIAFVMDPKATEEQETQLFQDLAAKLIKIPAKLDELAQRFIEELVRAKRLLALPAIFALYSDYLAKQKKQVEAEVVTIAPLSEQQQERLETALKRRFERDVKLTWKQDKTILGGIIIRAGDRVIDASVRSRLGDMIASIMA
jgi:F-type H+-transporting ATPase subunit delta